VPYRTWSSEPIAADDQFAFWQVAANGLFGPMTVQRAHDGPFRSRIVQAAVGPLTLSSVHADSHRSLRSESMAANDADGMVYISIPQAGLVSGRQSSRVITPRLGWLGMLSSFEPLTLFADAEFRQLVIGAPAELVASRLAAPVGVASATGVLCGLVATTAEYLFDHSADFDRADASRAAVHLTDLIVSAFGSIPGLTPRQFILQSAIDEAERRLADRTLNAAVLAESVHVSRRTLEKLFAERGTSVARWLLERRLERSRTELAETRSADVSVEVIAHRWGFADRTHFSRVFRDRFGVAPSRIRRAPAAVLAR